MKEIELKKITPEEQKKLMFDMLVYIDKLCRKNDIKYSAIGGTLIGAIRHKGFIPWDDDIDIILDNTNYKKLIKVLKNEKSSDYKALIPNETESYPLQFIKLVDLKTTLKEESLIDNIKDYGLFLDIFEYNYVPNEEKERRKYYNKCFFYQRSLARMKINIKKMSVSRIIKRALKNLYITIFGYKKNLNKLLNLYEKYSNKQTDYVVSNNPAYGYEKEIQKASDIKEYIDADFEGYKIMIFKNYDNILKTTFGDYMTIPPIEKRRVHNLHAYWKERVNNKEYNSN